MFEVYCPAHGTAVLLSIGRIEHIHSTPRGLALDWRCWCGQVGRTIGGRTPVARRSGARPDPEHLFEAS